MSVICFCAYVFATGKLLDITSKFHVIINIQSLLLLYIYVSVLNSTCLTAVVHQLSLVRTSSICLFQ